MAGMFYSLQETAERLKKTEQQVKELAKQGKLREFRDGPSLLFKVDEVETLSAKEVSPAAKKGLEKVQPMPVEQMPDMEQPLELEQPAEPIVEQAKAPPESAFERPAGPVPEEEISLALESSVSAAESGLTQADTALTGEGVSVLGETDKDYPITADTMAETIGATAVPGTTGTTPETPLEEVEEDVSLDTFGSGSGLLDLSLQADDTSLGGILDEIYTAAESEAKEKAESGSAVEIAAEAEQLLPEEEPVASLIATEAVVLAQSLVESQPDVQSNTLGMLLFLPMVLLIYTAIVTVAGQRGVVPSILAATQGAIWYIVIAAVVVAGVVIGAAFYLTGDFSKAFKKSDKPKKAKKQKSAPSPAADKAAD